MLAAAITLTLFGFILTLVVDVMRRDGAKILAALGGRSWTASPTAGRPVTIRFSQPDRVADSALQLPGLRVAA